VRGDPVSGSWDEAAWRALAAELDAWARAGREASFFWRDDDAGGAHPTLARLLALAAARALPLGLAVVPAWLTPEGAVAIHAAPDGVAVLQHGFAHANHERDPAPGAAKVRPAECGAARPTETVLAELAAGRDRLGTAFGARFLPVFVPPWNRIAPAVRAGLPRLGYRALSAFGRRPMPEPVPGLRHLNCHADPIRWREGKRFAGAAAALHALREHLAGRREGRGDPAEPTGLLTHHRDMEGAFWEFLEELWARFGAHRAVAFPAVATLLAS